jgi:hypothetical protein
MPYSLQRASPVDVCFLATVAEEADDWCAEDAAVTTIEGLFATCEASTQIWSTRDEEGLTTALWGVIPAPNPEVGRVWMLASKSLNGEPADLQSFSQFVFGGMLMKFSVLETFVDTRKRDAIDLLKTSGFTIEPPKPSPSGREMHRVWIGSGTSAGHAGALLH